MLNIHFSCSSLFSFLYNHQKNKKEKRHIDPPTTYPGTIYSLLELLIYGVGDSDVFEHALKLGRELAPALRLQLGDHGLL